MKHMKKTLLASAVAASLSAGAFAATINLPSTGTTFGKLIANESNRAVITPVATNIVLAAGEGLSVDDSITYTLSGGATFAAVVVGDMGFSNVGAVALVAGGTGTSSVSFRVTTAIFPASNITLATTATHNGATVAANGDIQTTVDMSGFVGGIPTSLFGSPLTSLSENLVPCRPPLLRPLRVYLMWRPASSS